jgi:CheY-like chemotaxis protein
VDDNPTTIFYNQDVVADYAPKSEIISFENPLEFINMYKQQYSIVEEPMLLFLDINMPQKLGYELLEELEETLDNIDNLHVIMVTSSNLRNDVEKSSKYLSVIGYIEKPLTLDKINQILNGF